MIVVVILARASLNIYSKVETSEIKLLQAQANLEKFSGRQQDISRKVEYLSTDQGIEAEIRTKYHAVKKGEQVAVIVDDAQKTGVFSSASDTMATSSPGFFGRILRSLGL